MMKGKPVSLRNTDKIDDFLAGAKATRMENPELFDVKSKANQKTTKPSTKTKEKEKVKEPTSGKFVRLPVDLLQQLKEESFNRSTIGSRVTESQLIEDAIRAYLGKK